jgi:hypothetical protein
VPAYRRGEAIICTYSECVFLALSNEHAKRLRRVILSCVPCLAVPHFSNNLINKIFRKEIFKHKKDFFILSTNSFGTVSVFERNLRYQVILYIHLALC